MKERTLEVMPVNSLWMLREKIDALLASKLVSEKEELERRLARLTGQNQKVRRPYPKVHPKYRNPERPDQTCLVEVTNPAGLLRNYTLEPLPKILGSLRPQAPSEEMAAETLVRKADGAMLPDHATVTSTSTCMSEPSLQPAECKCIVI